MNEHMHVCKCICDLNMCNKKVNIHGTYMYMYNTSTCTIPAHVHVQLSLLFLALISKRCEVNS